MIQLWQFHIGGIVAVRTGIICLPTDFCTGRCFLFYLFKVMATGIYLYRFTDFICSGFIWKQLHTLTALPVCLISRFCAVGFFLGYLFQIMAGGFDLFWLLDLGLSCLIWEKFSTGLTFPVFLISSFRTTGVLLGHFFQIMTDCSCCLYIFFCLRLKSIVLKCCTVCC